MHKWGAADRVLPHGGIKHYRWELYTMCKHAETQGDGEVKTESERDAEKRERCRRGVLQSNSKAQIQRERSYINKKKRCETNLSCSWQSLSSFSWSWPRRALLAATCLVTSALALWGEGTWSVCLLICLSECNRGWGRFSRHEWWQVRHSMPPHYSYSGRVQGGKRG